MPLSLPQGYFVAGEPAGSGISWLAEAITALLQKAELLGLAEAKAQHARQPEALSISEGLAWRECFAVFLELIMRHLKTLCEVCRLAQEVRISSLTCVDSQK